MKTQISRDSRQARKRYSGVYQQQGRMLTDADWNELVDILKARVDEALGQIVGSGAPKRAKTDGPLVPAKDKLAPGDLFADGVYARLRPSADQTGQFSYTQQADFPGAPALPAGDYLLYADVWERPVTALEDDGIRDPGLHGADTCTRTRTMVQVKWCPTAADLASVSKNPPCGNAAVTLVVHSGSDPSDGCDPCASEAKLSGSVGDYLFRLEVHDVKGDAGAPSEITLKWSTENAAEAHAGSAAPPAGYSGSQWVYEVFNQTSECHLGVHLGTTKDFPVRGTMKTSVPAAFTSGEFIRRWDGYATFTAAGANWKLADDNPGNEGITQLSTASGADAEGHVAFADGGVTINLRTLALTVALTGKQFVAGDYWLAEVRKNKHAAGAPKNAVLTGATPNGIVHHYLKLATVASGKLQVPTTKESQHLSFPKLTELDAGDVGYQAGASGFLDSTDDTVKKALDKLTGLPASSVPYTPLHPQPGSANHVFEATDDTVQKALDKVCGIQARNVRFTRPKQAENSIYQVAATPVDTVDEALKLLANLMAAHVKFEPKNCSILEKAATVQAALEDLCATLEKSLLDNSARLLLFGRGVLCGLIPAVAVKATSSATGITAITVTASPGKYIDGKGGLRQVDTPLSLTADAKAYKTQYSFDRGTMASAVSDLQVFASQERKLKTVTMQPAIMARAVATLTARLTAATSKLPVFGDKVEAANWAQVDNLDMAHPEMAEKVGEILIGSMKATTVPAEVQLYLYVTLDSGVPALQVKFTAPSPVADGIPGRQIHPPGDVESVLDPSGAEVPGSVRNLQKAVWAPYQSAECPHPNSGEVCLGMLGVSASHVFVCPDFREQIEFTPAQDAARRAGDLWKQKVANKLTYPDLADTYLK